MLREMIYLLDVINNIQKEPHPKSHSKMDDEPGKIN